MNLLFLNLGTQEMALISLPFLIFFVYTFYHVFTNKHLTTYKRLLWMLIIVFGNLLGGLLYWALGKHGDARIWQSRNVG